MIGCLLVELNLYQTFLVGSSFSLFPRLPSMAFDEKKLWDLPSEPKEDNRKCRWAVNSTEKPPHFIRSIEPLPKILPDITYAIGNTPLVKLNKIPQSEGLQCEILAKCEFLNPGGSVKDRIAKRMVKDAQDCGRIKPGDTLVEPSSGNTGIGVSLVSAAWGYKSVIVMPDKNSNEKEHVIRGLGADVIRTPTHVRYDDPASQNMVARVRKN